MSAPIRQNCDGQNVTANCESCDWFDPKPRDSHQYAGENGYCRINPPQRTGGDGYFSYWPVVKFNDWCAKWSSK